LGGQQLTAQRGEQVCERGRLQLGIGGAVPFGEAIRPPMLACFSGHDQPADSAAHYAEPATVESTSG
jgi:hypothetical protein